MSEFLRYLNERPIAYYPAYKKITGSVHGAILLSQLMYWFSKKDKFYKKNDEIQAEIGFTERELKTAKTHLKKATFITISKEGLPAKTYYEINWNQYQKAIENLDNTVQASKDETVTTVCDETVTTVCDETVTTITKNTTETTTKNIPPNPQGELNEQFSPSSQSDIDLHSVINHWIAVRNCNAIRKDSTLTRRITKLLKEYTFEEITKTIDKLNTAITSPEYYYTRDICLFEFVEKSFFSEWLHKSLDSVKKFEDPKKKMTQREKERQEQFPEDEQRFYDMFE